MEFGRKTKTRVNNAVEPLIQSKKILFVKLLISPMIVYKLSTYTCILNVKIGSQAHLPSRN